MLDAVRSDHAAKAIAPHRRLGSSDDLGLRDRLWVVVTLCLGATLGLFFAYMDLSVFLVENLSRDQVFGRDFAAFWTAARLTLGGHAAEVFDPAAFAEALRRATGEAVGFNPYPYPPHGLFLVLPAGLLPYLWAYAIWMIGLAAGYLLAARRVTGATAAWVVLLAPATVVTVAMGQNGLLTASLMLGGFAALPRRPVLAGLLFGLLTFKPQLGLLIPLALAAAGHWRAFAAAAAATLVLLAASLALVGVAGWEAYVTEVLGTQGRFMAEGEGVFMQMVPSPFMAMRLLGFDAAAGYALQGILALVAATATFWAWRRQAAPPARLAVVLVGTFLVSPYVFNYDMTILSAAVVLLAREGLRGGFAFGERAVLAAAWLMPVAMMYLHAIAPVAPVVVVALFLLTIRRVLCSSESTQAAAPA